MTKKSKEAVVIKAMTAPEVEHDDLIDQILARSQEEYARSSDAGESGAKVTAFLEKTGLNSQAFAWGKTILKKLPKKDGQAKAMDVIRSMELILPMLKAHVGGQGTGELPLEPAQPASEPTAPVTEADVQQFAPDDDEEIEGPEIEPFDPDIEAEDEAFNRQLRAVQ